MNWSTLLSTFGLVFIAELGDKTQLAVMTQTCKYRRPWVVFVGASLALTLVTALGVLGGRVVGALIPADVIRYLAVGAFIVMGALIWREARKRDVDENACGCPDPEGHMSDSIWDWKAFGSTFSLLFLAELGDKTQLAVLSLASREALGPVFVGGALALTAVTALGAVGGQQLCRWLPERLLLRISAVAFVAMGVLMALGIL
ncbi:MAG: TMEM165/GDT1 family protein [Anaerolineales bacterium]